MAYTITETCIGCTACQKVCPTDAIVGVQKYLHEIDPKLCIDCGACARVCPVECIADQHGVLQPRVPKRADWPKPVVFPDLCTGCSFCVDVCPFDCLKLTDGGPMWGTAELVNPKDCVSCRLCEQVCAKNAIIVMDVKEMAAAS